MLNTRIKTITSDLPIRQYLKVRPYHAIPYHSYQSIEYKICIHFNLKFNSNLYSNTRKYNVHKLCLNEPKLSHIKIVYVILYDSNSYKTKTVFIH